MSAKWMQAWVKGAAVALAAVLATSCSLSLSPVAAPTVGKLPRVIGKSATPYARTVQLEPDTFVMQTGSRSFRRARAPEIVLVGAVHVAESDYYRGLQQRLNQADLVLYEGVAKQAAGKAATDPALVGRTAYGRLARSLGLVAQKPSIDYARKSFRRCDLSLEEMQALLAQETARGGG